MAKYPVKLLKDKDGTAFVPVVNSDSIITPEGDTLNDLLEEKQDLLTSGTNIKTINNESLLGSGNISIQGGDTGGTVTSVKINATSPIAIDNNAAITTSGERTISHANSGVTAGTYKSVTVDSKGHVTAGTNPTTLSGYGITDAGISNGTITLGSNTITPSTVQNIKDGSSTGSLRSSGSRTENANYTIGSYAFAEGYNTKASGGNSHAEGNFTEASGNSSHAEGSYTKAIGTISHAEGNYTEASGNQSHAEGYYTIASGSDSHAEGIRTVANGNNGSHSEGYYAEANGNYGAHAEGNDTRAIGNSSHAEGNGAVASNSYSHAEGWDTIASGKYSHVEGGRNDSYLFIGTVVSLDAANQTYEVSGVPKEAINDSLFYSGAFFSKTNNTDSDQRIVSATRSSSTNNVTFTVSTFDSSIVVGDNFRVFAGSKASGDYSHAEGHRTYAIGNNSHTEGYDTIATGAASHTEGYNTIASGSQSHAGGFCTKANKDYQTAIGKYNKNVNNALLEIGNGTADDSRSNAFVVYSDGKAELGADPTSSMHVATKQYVDNKTSSVALSNIKDGSATGSVRTNFSSSEDSSYTIGDCSFTEGFRTKASGDRSHAEGSFTTASGDYSHTEGNWTTASGGSSHAEGYTTIASGNYSHAEGYYTQASGNYSPHAEGYYTTASGGYSHAEGNHTTASGSCSHAEGYWARTGGKGSHAEGGWDSSIPYNIVGTVVSIDTENKTYEVSGLTRYSDSNNNYVGAMYYNSSNGCTDSYYITSETYNTTTKNFTFEVSYIDSSIVVGGSFYIKISSTALGDFSHSEGRNTFAPGTGSHAEGWNTIARYSGSHAEGDSTYAGPFSHAEGSWTTAESNGSHTEGYDTFTKGYGAHAEGFATRALGYYSHAEGGGDIVTGTVVSLNSTDKTYEVSGLTRYVTNDKNYIGCVFSYQASYGYGNQNKIVSETYDSTTGNFTFTVTKFDETHFNVGDSFYIIMGCTAWGDGSHASGLATIAKKNFQTVIGTHNDNKSDTLFEIGNGSRFGGRSNAFEVYSDGRAIVGADPTTAMGVATKQYVDNNSGGEKIPIGTIFEFPTDDATKLPTGYLFCDGSAVSRTQYADLFGVIGTTFGAGDGSTTFNLPNLKGKVPVGLDSNDTDFDTLGETGGEKKHTLTQSELPNYNLKGLKWANSGAAITLDSGSHTPGYSLNYGYNGVNEGQIDNIIINSGGSNTPHSNLQPYIVVNYIIKASQTTPVQAQIVDSYSESTTDGYSANYINQKTNIITAYLANATYSITASGVYEKIPLDGSEKVGNKLTLNSNGEIVVGAGVTKIKASAKICMVGNTITSGTKNFVIMKNGTIVERIWNKIDTFNSTLIIPMSMFSVAEGDKITMAYYGAQNETANYGSPFTALTVEVVS